MDDQASVTIRALRALQVQPSGPTRILSYGDDFGRLWEYVADPALLDEHVGRGSLFIVWDCVPQYRADRTFSQLSLGNFLTVYDWIAALMLAVDARLRGMQPSKFLSVPDIRVHILDVSDPYKYQRSIGVASRIALQGIAPWVTISSLDQNQASTFVRAVHGAEGSGNTMREQAATPSWGAAIRIIRSLWQGEITKAGSRHTVSNAIAPITLALSLRKYEGSGALLETLGLDNDGDHPLRSFWQLLELLDLVPSLPPREKREPRPTLASVTGSATVRADLFGRFRKVRFLLIDDLAEAGFHDILSFFLLGEIPKSADAEQAVLPNKPARTSVGNSHSLISYLNAEPLLCWIETIARGMESETPRRPKLIGRQPVGPQLPEFDIVFLDLRLYPDQSPRSATAEISGINRLINLYDTHIKHKLRDTLPCKRREALDIAIEASRAAKASVLPGEQRFAHFSLIPIMISVLDPSVPIVLFSSTRQRRLLELLRPFPNIITSFAKPMVSGYAEDRDAQSTAVADLSDALLSALLLHESRFIWELLSRTSFELAESPPHWLERTREKSFEPKAPTRFLVDDVNVQSILDVYENCLLDNSFYEALFRPFEILEYALLSAHETQSEYARLHFNETIRRDGAPPSELDFDGMSIHPPEKMREQMRMMFCNAIKQIRNAYSHGAFVGRADNPEVIRLCALTQLRLFIACINKEECELFFNAVKTGGTVFASPLDTMLLRPKSAHPQWRGLIPEFRDTFYRISKWNPSRLHRA